MKVISIGTDSKLFEDNSSVLERQKEYASKMEELHIVVFTNNGFEVRHINNLHIYPTNSKIFSIINGWRIIRKIIKNKNGFVVTTQDPFETGLLGLFTKKIYKLPLQVQVHTDFLDSHFRNSILNKIRVFISKLVIPKADGVRVVSSVIKDSLVEKYPQAKEKIDILPIWVDIEKIFRFDRQFYSPEKNALKILMASRLTREKRIDIALEVLKKVKDKVLNVGLTIVGSGPEKKKLFKQKKDLGLGDEVSILEWQKEIMSAYKSADVFLLTSEFEGYGMTLIEAGASGCPIVTTKVGLAKTDLFKDGVNSYVCPVGDVECLSSKLLDLLGDESKRKMFAQNMRESIQKVAITKEEYISRYVFLLENLTK